MRNKDNNLVNQCCSLHNLELSEFSKKFDIKESTLKTWRKDLPSYGKLLLETLIQNYNLKVELEVKNKKIFKLQERIKKIKSK